MVIFAIMAAVVAVPEMIGEVKPWQTGHNMADNARGVQMVEAPKYAAGSHHALQQELNSDRGTTGVDYRAVPTKVVDTNKQVSFKINFNK